jgi:uncharacterized membrane protein YdbT with pleckstrin-like domain
MARSVEAHGYLRKILGPGEQVLFITRQHGLFLFGRIFLWLAAAIAIVGTVAVITSASGNSSVLVGAPLAILPMLVVWWQWLQWSNHAYVLTNRRVIQLNGVLSKQVVDSLLEKLNDIKTSQTLFGRMFGYGNVEILTANEVGNNVFEHIADPLEFKSAMLQAKQALDTSGVKS